MSDELTDVERRYLGAYSELEAEDSTTVDHEQARARVLAAAFSDAPQAASPPPPRRSAAVMLLSFGMGAAAVAALAVAWMGIRGQLGIFAGTPSHEQAPLTLGRAAQHEATPHPTDAPRTAPPTRPTTPTHVVEPPTQESPLPETTPAPPPAPKAARSAARPHASRRVSSTAARREPPPAAVEPRPPASATLDGAEVTRLEHARRLGQRGQYRAALRELDDHAQVYPNSLLATERDAERVVALCHLEDPAAASARADLLAGTPPRYLVRRVTRACDGPQQN